MSKTITRAKTQIEMEGGEWSYSNPYLSINQPWASLLVHGIKRIEGQSWTCRITGRLWIHASLIVPEPETIKAMEDFYREIYAVDGITDIKFPENYPVNRLIGCVEVVGCLRCDELVSWEAVPESVRLEGLTRFCWLCEQPQKLSVPFEMRGCIGIYYLEKRIYDAAVRGLRPVEGPQPVKFPLPDPHDKLSLRPGSLTPSFSCSKTSSVEKPPSVNAAIAGARSAATQFSKKDQLRSTFKNQTDIIQYEESEGTSQNVSMVKNRRLDDHGLNHVDQQTAPYSKGNGKNHNIAQNDDSEITSQNVCTIENRRFSHNPNNLSDQDDHSLNHVDQHSESRGSGRTRRIAAGNGLSSQFRVPSSKVSRIGEEGKRGGNEEFKEGGQRNWFFIGFFLGFFLAVIPWCIATFVLLCRLQQNKL